jgi:hypothetical protein
MPPTAIAAARRLVHDLDKVRTPAGRLRTATTTPTTAITAVTATAITTATTVATKAARRTTKRLTIGTSRTSVSANDVAAARDAVQRAMQHSTLFEQQLQQQQQQQQRDTDTPVVAAQAAVCNGNTPTDKSPQLHAAYSSSSKKIALHGAQGLYVARCISRAGLSSHTRYEKPVR